MKILNGSRLAAVLLLVAFPWLAPAQPEHGAIVLPVGAAPGEATDALLDPAHPAWNNAPESRLQFSRTPPLYASDPVDDGTRPAAAVRLLRLRDDAVALRVRWSDATRNETGNGARFPDAGAPQIYKQHSTALDAFPDALCVMAPVKRGAHEIYPALMMGQPGQPAELYFWRAGAGFQVLGAHGRASTAATAAPLAGNAVHDGAGWTVALIVPGLVSRTPVSFAIWDGAGEQRDGLKYFTVWHEVQ